MSESKVICQIYRSSREEGMYLYTRKEDALTRVPEELLQRFGQPQPAMVLVLTPERKLARVSAIRVMECLNDPGYYLQLPPSGEQDPEQQQIQRHNAKL